jgi:hypothetical protein
MKLGKIALVLFFIALIGVGGIGYFYFFQISPTFVEKPHLDRPSLDPLINDMNESHIKYLLNELDAYKLHDDPLTGEPPIIKIELTDIDEEFTYTVEDNNLELSESLEPDLILKGNSNDVISVLTSSDLEKSIIDAVNSGDIKIKLVADEKTLALKGYKSIYDKISSNEITGAVVTKLGMSNVNNGLSISLLFFISLILGLIIERDH